MSGYMSLLPQNDSEDQDMCDCEAMHLMFWGMFSFENHVRDHKRWTDCSHRKHEYIIENMHAEYLFTRTN
jgi:hypothetical protein